MTSAVVSGLGFGTAHALTELSGIASAIERVFLEAGNGLGQAIGCWRTVSNTFVALAAQFDRDDMLRCIDDLGTALAVAAALGGDGGGALARLTELGGRLDVMRARLDRLNRTIAEVKLVALNAKVEAAHLDEHSSDFSVFTREIDRLARDAACELAILDNELRALSGETAAARTTQAGFTEKHGAELIAVTHRLKEGLRTLTRQRQQVTEAATTIGERSRLAGDRVGQAVTALQIGDITRQRTEHVVEALGVLTSSGVQDLAGEDAAQATALIASLQARQVLQAAADLEHEVAQVADNLSALAGETESIMRLGQDSFGSGEDSFLAHLGREIGKVERLLDDYANAHARTEDTMTAVADATAAMVAHVEAIHSIEADLKVMALNASFKCARLGSRGSTLSVVAQSLRQLANRTVEDAGVLMSGLQAAMTTAHALARGQDGGDGNAIGRTIDRLRETAQVLAATGAEQGAALAVLENHSRRAQELLRAGAAAIAVSDEFAERLRAVAVTLSRAADNTPIDADRADHLKDLVLSRLGANYTMASERVLHGLFGGSDAPLPSGDDESVDVDDLLF